MEDRIIPRDITAYLSIKEAAQEPVLHNCSLFEHALEGIFRSTPAGRFTAVNPALVRILGYESAEEVLALTLPDDLYVDPTQRAHLRAAYEAAGVLEGVEVHWKKRGGEHIIVSLYARTIRDAHGTVIGYEGMVLDITERKRMEEVLRQSEARYQTISDLISDYAYAVRIEPDGRTVVEWVTEAFSRITGFTVQELEEGGGIVRVIHPNDMPSVLQRLCILLSGQPGVSEHRIITKNGEIRWLRDYSCPEWNPIQNRIVRIVGAGQDITERKQTEAAVLEERNRIAREMHDTLAQSLAGIVLHMEAAQRVLTAAPEKARTRLEEACTLARESLAEAYRSVMALRPQTLEQHDLPTVLTHLAAQAAASPQTHLAFRLHGTPRTLPAEVETNLLRITQEALTNACNHAQAQDIAIDLTFGAHRIQLRVQDDGQGFNIHRVASRNGFGLTGMRERAEQIGGRFTVTSRPGKGTTVVVIVPNSRSF